LIVPFIASPERILTRSEPSTIYMGTVILIDWLAHALGRNVDRMRTIQLFVDVREAKSLDFICRTELFGLPTS
jgi:hypothetical protein